MIGIEALSKARGGTRVLTDVTLRAGEREVTAIVGPSGGGKSTLLRCLNGLEVFDTGEVTVAGHRMRPGSHPPRLLEQVRRDVGMVFQQFNLFPHLSVLENVALGPRVVARLPPAEARVLAEAQLDRVGMASFAAARPATLSGGQQQRVAIARALALAPRVMLFDEPTSALDPAMSAEVMETIVALARGGQTMVVVTHDHAFARRAATQVVELVAGRITRTGPPADVLGA
ncbi:MAG: amino acid ABC transporter ATP-binding protein [Planctomycetia bacterium]